MFLLPIVSIFAIFTRLLCQNEVQLFDALLHGAFHFRTKMLDD